MTSPTLITLTPELIDALKERSYTTLTTIVKTNSSTVFFRESPALENLRKELVTLCDKSNAFPDPLDIAGIFSVVPLSTYDDYLPFVSRFNETPCRASRVSDLLAPGLPVYLNNSSGTTNGPLKILPKYQKMAKSLPKELFNGNTCIIISLGILQRLDVMGDGVEGTKIENIPSCYVSGSLVRMMQGIGFSNDEALMPKKFPNLTSPYAAHFIQPYQTFVLIHGLYALADSSLAGIVTTFSSLVYDLIRLLEEHWDTLVQAIANGLLPKWDGLDNITSYLQDHFQPNRKRAAELRNIEVGTEGWLKNVWPQLISVRAIYSGPYGSAVAKIRYHFGPSIALINIAYVSTECALGSTYDPNDLNLFKVSSANYVEYLNIEGPESAEKLCQPWEIEAGSKYEVIATSEDGLWRYRLGDVLEVAGFDPVDGQPLLRYIERRNLTLRVYGEYMTEQVLRDGLHSLRDYFGDVIEFTSFVDDRKTPPAYGFMVELETPHLGTPSQETLTRLHSFLSARNSGYSRYAQAGFISTPTMRIVAPGTFRMYREWKGRGRSGASGQIKVPAVMHDVGSREWLSRQAVLEL